MTTDWIGAALLVAALPQAMGTMPMATPAERTPPVAAAPACPAAPAPLPALYAGWAATARPAGTAAATAPALAIGVGARLALADAATVQFAVAPAREQRPASNGGLATVTVPTAGRYRVALGSGAWVDLIDGSTALRSVAHGHGAPCSPVAKMVDFDLAPGRRYLLELSGTTAPAVAVMVVRVPAAGG